MEKVIDNTPNKHTYSVPGPDSNYRIVTRGKVRETDRPGMKTLECGVNLSKPTSM